MTIEISDNVIMSTALSKVEEGEYFDALTLFARVNSYESMLNQLGCLIELRDTSYVAELYSRLLINYGFTHNCYADIAKMGGCMELLGSLYVVKPKGDKLSAGDGKISANEELLGYYPLDLDDDDDYESSEELLGELLGGEVAVDQRQIYDVKSPEYFDSLRIRLEKAVFSGNYEQARAVQDEIMSIQTDDVNVLEMQQLLCWVSSMWDEGLNYALQLAEMKGVSLRGLRVSVRMLAHAGSQHKSVLRRQLTKLLDYGEEIDDSDMAEFVRISANILGYERVTLDLATVLCHHYRDAGCSALRLCSRVLYNCNDIEFARDATLMLLRAAPWDCYGKMMLSFINANYNIKLDGVFEGGGVLGGFDIPEQLAVIAEGKLLNKLENGDNLLQRNDYVYLECLLKVCRSCLVRGQIERFVAKSEIFANYLDRFIPQDVNQFVTFAKNGICSALTEPVLNKCLIYKLLQLGYKNKLLISIGREYYVLDVSRLKLLSDEIFCEALSICATIRKVDATKLEKNYKRLCETVEISRDNLHDTARQVAYCIMALTYKSFPDKGEGVHFVDGDDKLYLQFVFQGDK